MTDLQGVSELATKLAATQAVSYQLNLSIEGPFLLAIIGAAVALRRPGMRSIAVVYGFLTLGVITSLLVAMSVSVGAAQVPGLNAATVDRTLTMFFFGVGWTATYHASQALSGRARSPWPAVVPLLIGGLVVAAIGFALYKIAFRWPHAASTGTGLVRGLIAVCMTAAAFDAIRESATAPRNRGALRALALGYSAVAARQLFNIWVQYRSLGGVETTGGAIVSVHSTTTVLNGVAFLAAVMLEERAANLEQSALLRSGETTLRESEQRYRALVERTPESVIVHRDGKVIYVNEAAVRLFGAESEHQLVGMATADIIHPESRALMMDRINEPGSGPAGAPQFELKMRRLDGTVLDVEVESTVVEFDGAPAVHVTGHDISARARAERAARENRQLLEAIIDSSPAQIFAFDLQHRFTLANDAVARFYGLTKRELVGKSLHDVLPPGLADELRAENRRIMLMAESDYREVVVPSGDGQSSRVLMTSRFPLLDELGTVCGLAGVATDVTESRAADTERSKLTAQLQQAQKMESVGRLAGGVAHDFNNMLGVIIGHVELAIRQIREDNPIREDLVEIRNAADRSTSLTRQLLTFARQQVVVPKVVDLNDTVTHALRMLRRTIGEDIKIAWQPEERAWPVFVDPSQVEQILINLCVNARDAIADVGTISLATANVVVDEHHAAVRAGASPGEYLRLTVRDDGSGMTRETLAHVFEPFFTTKPTGEGTGLGLATVYGAVKQSGGATTVSSTPGQGTTFDLFFPRYTGPVEPAEYERPQLPASRGHETILLVEDEPAILKLTARALDEHGYVVLCANSPAEAIRHAAAHTGTIDLLLSDVVMPDMNGRDLSMLLIEVHPELKQLFVSGYPSGVIASRGVLDEGVHFLAKPFSLADLIATVRAVLDGAPAGRAEVRR